jgi:hypothetical protein
VFELENGFSFRVKKMLFFCAAPSREKEQLKIAEQRCHDRNEMTNVENPPKRLDLLILCMFKLKRTFVQ